MSTRSCIARIKGDGFAGVYHHWDGYPTVLGTTLYQMAQRFRSHEPESGGVAGMLRLLIDQHPAGWSTINGADWSQEPGMREEGFDNGKGPECYCHGGRSEEGQLVTHADDMGMEWAYVFDERALTMAVVERVRLEGEHAVGMFGTLGANPETGEREDTWAIRAVVQLEGPEPDWSRIECGPNLERCCHVEGYHERLVPA